MSSMRFCVYVNGERTEDHKFRYIVVNYKKDAKCPYIKPEKYPNLISLKNLCRRPPATPEHVDTR